MGFEEDVQLGARIDWVQCVCTRWLHEECVIDSIVDANGKERLFRRYISLIEFFKVRIINCDI